jgi:hypothetical protein
MLFATARGQRADLPMTIDVTSGFSSDPTATD